MNAKYERKRILLSLTLWKWKIGGPLTNKLSSTPPNSLYAVHSSRICYVVQWKSLSQIHGCWNWPLQVCWGPREGFQLKTQLNSSEKTLSEEALLLRLQAPRTNVCRFLCVHKQEKPQHPHSVWPDSHRETNAPRKPSKLKNKLMQSPQTIVARDFIFPSGKSYKAQECGRHSCSWHTCHCLAGRWITA